MLANFQADARAPSKAWKMSWNEGRASRRAGACWSTSVVRTLPDILNTPWSAHMGFHIHTPGRPSIAIIPGQLQGMGESAPKDPWVMPPVAMSPVAARPGVSTEARAAQQAHQGVQVDPPRWLRRGDALRSACLGVPSSGVPIGSSPLLIPTRMGGRFEIACRRGAGRRGVQLKGSTGYTDSSGPGQSRGR